MPDLNHHRQLKNLHHEKGIFKQRIGVIFLIFSLLVFGLLLRLYQMQVAQYHHYQQLSQKNRLEFLPIAPKRGLIYDRNHHAIANNKLIYTLTLKHKKHLDVEKSIIFIQSLIKLSKQNIKDFHKQFKHSKTGQAVRLKTNLTPQQVAKLYVNLFRIPEAQINTEFERHYPVKDIYTPILGYVGKINSHDLTTIDPSNYQATPFIGKNGIEHYYENLLHGQTGHQAIEVNVGGYKQKDIERTEPTPGHNLTLTVDGKLQEKTYKILANENAAVVAINPQNGDILALVSHPSFDNNLFAHGISSKAYKALLHDPNLPLYNRALNGQFPPASTIKPFIALAALDQGIIDRNTLIDDHGTFQLPHTHHIYRDWLINGHGQVDLTKAIIYSCDVFFYKLAVKMGMHNVLPLLKQFGFGQKIQVDTDFLSYGILSSPQWKQAHKATPWYTGDTIISFIGQGNMLTTPLQLAQATALLAMRGRGFQPHFLKAVTTADQHTYFFQPIPAPKIQIKKDAWDQVIHAMHGVIFSHLKLATGWRFGRPKYSVAGKTGTAQVIHDERKSRQSNIQKKFRDHSWFIGFAPVEHPTIAVAVICEHSHNAAQIARKVMDSYLLHH